jgi:hypothetical protein
MFCRKDMPSDTIHIPLPFDQTIAAVLKVKPPAKNPKPKAKANSAPNRIHKQDRKD